MGAVRLVVLGDSFAFTDDTGPKLPGHPTLFPTVVADELARATAGPVEPAVIARAGWTARELWRALTKDQHLQFEVLPGADAVVLAVGSFDHVPAGIPAGLEALVPFVRPAPVRRRVRELLRRAHPRVVAVTRGRFPLTPTGEFAAAYDRVLFQLRALTQGAAGVALGPAGQASPHYAQLNPHLAARSDIQRDLAERHGFAYVPAWPLVEPALGRLNVDGVHWPADVHAAVGRALAAALSAQLLGDVSRPAIPTWDDARVN